MDPSAVAPADEYIYEPLSYDHEYCQPIRLLNILPGDPGSVICCKLFKTYLSTAEGRENGDAQHEDTPQQTNRPPLNVEYYALSYMWGDAQDRIPIHVDGKQLLVTRNLEAFLRRQRDTFSPMEKSPRTFWIDAICIDQRNLNERSKQVAFMADIYKEAKTVLVWLGEPKWYTPVAFTALLCQDSEWDLYSDQEKGAIYSTFKLGYWERLWIVQELYHAQRITVRSGSREVDWASLPDRTHPGSNVRVLEDYRQDRPYIRSLATDHVLAVDYAMDVLDTYGSRDCLDPRDSVYGLRSLTHSLMSLVPDYSLSIAQVYTAATRAIISSSGSIKVLEVKIRQKPISQWNLALTNDLPSWVPDWKMPSYGSLSWILELIDPNAGLQNSEYKNGDVSEVLSHNNLGCLLLKGIVVDSVIYSTGPYEEPKENWDEGKGVKQLHSWLPKCDTTIFRDKCGLTVERYQAGTGRVTLKLGTLLNHYFLLLGYQGTFFDKFTAYVDKKHLREIEGNAVLFTKNGYGGIVLGEPKIDDLVFVAYRSCYPYIIRRTKAAEESYTLVGCAFIKGLMNGQAIEMKEDGILVERTISLV